MRLFICESYAYASDYAVFSVATITKKLLKTPENIIPLSLISLGFTNEEQNTIDKLDISRIHKNYWKFIHQLSEQLLVKSTYKYTMIIFINVFWIMISFLLLIFHYRIVYH
jgi:hypothetical protein